VRRFDFLHGSGTSRQAVRLSDFDFSRIRKKYEKRIPCAAEK